MEKVDNYKGTIDTDWIFEVEEWDWSFRGFWRRWKFKMRKLTKHSKKAVVGLFICFLGVICLLNLLNTQKIHKGINKKIAIEKCMENQNCYMVKFSETNTGLTYIISEGKDTGVEVELKGNTPLSHLSNVFRDGRNEFLVYGYEMNAEQKTTNVSALEDIVNPYTIVVEKWEIVMPIYRDYTYASHGRIFYPRGYIDSYDLRYGDYAITE